MTFADQDDTGQETHILQLGIKQCNLNNKGSSKQEQEKNTQNLKSKNGLINKRALPIFLGS